MVVVLTTTSLPPAILHDTFTLHHISLQLSDDVWRTLIRWFETPPVEQVDGFLAANALALTEARVLTAVLVNTIGSGLAKRAEGVMAEVAAPRRKRARTAPNTYGGRVRVLHTALFRIVVPYHSSPRPVPPHPVRPCAACPRFTDARLPFWQAGDEAMAEHDTIKKARTEKSEAAAKAKAEKQAERDAKKQAKADAAEAKEHADRVSVLGELVEFGRREGWAGAFKALSSRTKRSILGERFASNPLLASPPLNTPT